MHCSDLELVTITQKQERIFSDQRATSIFEKMDIKETAAKSALKRYRKVTQYNLLGEKVAVHAGIVTAAKALGISKTNIGAVLKRIRLTAGGAIWKYGDGPDTIELNGYWTINPEIAVLFPKAIRSASSPVAPSS